MIAVAVLAVAAAVAVNEWRVTVSTRPSASIDLFWAATCLTFAVTVAAITLAAYTATQI